MNIGALAKLSCGNYDASSDIGEALSNISFTLSKLESRIKELPRQDDETITMLGPFYARTILENVCIALIGRLDSFRLLFIKNIQQHCKLELGKPSNATIR